VGQTVADAAALESLGRLRTRRSELGQMVDGTILADSGEKENDQMTAKFPIRVSGCLVVGGRADVSPLHLLPPTHLTLLVVPCSKAQSSGSICNIAF
jgi:hypothetical protein